MIQFRPLPPLLPSVPTSFSSHSQSAYFGEWEEAYLIFVDLLASLIAADPSAAARSGWLDDEGIPSTLLAISIGMQARRGSSKCPL